MPTDNSIEFFSFFEYDIEMKQLYESGDRAFFIENGRIIKEVIVLKNVNSFCTVEYPGRETMFRIRESKKENSAGWKSGRVF